jgi:hypothetical protein
MTPITVRPTRADLSVAKIISTHTGPRTERAAAFLTWGADEHILCALAAGWWLYCRGKDANARRASDHILLTTLVASGLPHILKTVFDQERPDRKTIQGHWRGVPFSGNRLDAFPSGHAVHIEIRTETRCAASHRRQAVTLARPGFTSLTLPFPYSGVHR